MALLTEEQELALQLGFFEISSPFQETADKPYPGCQRNLTEEIERDQEFEWPATD